MQTEGGSSNAKEEGSVDIDVSTATLFGFVWSTLADVLGTAAAAAIVRARRARACGESPELRRADRPSRRPRVPYTLPPAWSKTTQTAARGEGVFAPLVAEMGRLLRRADGHRRHPPARAGSGAARTAGSSGGPRRGPRRRSDRRRPDWSASRPGSAAFDRILGGGLPVRSVNVIAGEPGAGKTLFSLQMLFALARQGKKGLYFTTLSEPSLKLIQYMQQFSFFDESLLDERDRLRRPRLGDPAPRARRPR